MEMFQRKPRYLAELLKKNYSRKILGGDSRQLDSCIQDMRPPATSQRASYPFWTLVPEAFCGASHPHLLVQQALQPTVTEVVSFKVSTRIMNKRSSRIHIRNTKDGFFFLSSTDLLCCCQFSLIEEWFDALEVSINCFLQRWHRELREF